MGLGRDRAAWCQLVWARGLQGRGANGAGSATDFGPALFFFGGARERDAPLHPGQHHHQAQVRAADMSMVAGPVRRRARAVAGVPSQQTRGSKRRWLGVGEVPPAFVAAISQAFRSNTRPTTTTQGQTGLLPIRWWGPLSAAGHFQGQTGASFFCRSSVDPPKKRENKNTHLVLPQASVLRARQKVGVRDHGHQPVRRGAGGQPVRV